MTATLFRRAALLAVLLSIGGGVAACDNTIRGVGRDVRESGQAVHDEVHGTDPVPAPTERTP